MSRTLDIGLINNMPDGALAATERQFSDLLGAAAAARAVVRLKLFSLPDVPRSEAARRQMATRYFDVEELWGCHLDGLIVTGTEPRAPALKDEPYWPTLRSVVDWAQENTTSAIWSCLAAHAAVLHADGIDRYALEQKRSGVFDCVNMSGYAIMKGTAPRLRIPHSRCNDLPEAALISCGYSVLTHSAQAGLDTFAKQGRSLFIFFQGHPEYATDTLLREYRRDIGRFLRRERESYPAMPVGYFDDETAGLLHAFRERAIAARTEDVLACFPMSAAEAGLQNSWRASAVAMYGNWLSYLFAGRAARQPAGAVLRGPWRSSALPVRGPEPDQAQT